MTKQKENLWFFEDIRDNWTRAITDQLPKVIAIPTTAGTGSETGRASLILDESDKTKKIIFHPSFLPDLVILDPNLTLSLPPVAEIKLDLDQVLQGLVRTRDEILFFLSYHFRPK